MTDARARYKAALATYHAAVARHMQTGSRHRQVQGVVARYLFRVQQACNQAGGGDACRQAIETFNAGTGDVGVFLNTTAGLLNREPPSAAAIERVTRLMGVSKSARAAHVDAVDTLARTPQPAPPAPAAVIFDPSSGDPQVVPFRLCCPPNAQASSVELRDGVTIIGGWAFASNHDITEIELPASVVRIHEGAFIDCKGMKRLVLPEGLVEIPPSMCRNCHALTDIVIPASVTKIGAHAFSHSGLRSVTFAPNSALAEIGDCAFAYCDHTKIIVLPGSVIKVRTGAFQRSKSLKAIAFSLNLKVIPYDACKECPNLTTVYLPPGLVTIHRFAFANCTALKFIDFPGGIQKIGVGAFRGCTAVDDLFVPDSCTDIGGAAFSGCTALATLTAPRVGITAMEPASTSCTCCSPAVKATRAAKGLAPCAHGDVYAKCPRLTRIQDPTPLMRSRHAARACWSPETHRISFPPLQRAVLAVMLCANRIAAGTTIAPLPRELWHIVLAHLKRLDPVWLQL